VGSAESLINNNASTAYEPEVIASADGNDVAVVIVVRVETLKG
jgi:hypothetical protein